MSFDRAGQGAVNSGRAVGDPSVGKLLRDELAGLRSCPVGRFRIIYRVADLEARAA